MTPIHIGGSDINHLTVCDPDTQITTADLTIAYLPLTGGVIDGNLAVTGTINNIVLDSNSKLTDTIYDDTVVKKAINNNAQALNNKANKNHNHDDTQINMSGDYEGIDLHEAYANTMNSVNEIENEVTTNTKTLGEHTSAISEISNKINANVQTLDQHTSTINEIKNEVNANTQALGGHTIRSNVPLNAKFTDTTYKIATQQQTGLFSADDKKKLDNIEAGAQVNKLRISVTDNILNITQEVK